MTSHLFHGHGTGALKLTPDFRDFKLRLHPKVAPMMTAMPDAYSLRRYQKGPALDQDGKAACTAGSSSHMQAFYEVMERGKWIVFDWDRLYTENGGTGNNGLSSRDVLQDLQDQGCPVLGSDERYKIKQYAFVDFSSNFDLAIQTVKAAIAADCPVVLAMLLPSDFGERECGKPNSTVTSSYHQVMIGGYSPDGLDPFNSWGPSFADLGWCHIRTEFLARPQQRGWLYAFTTLDAPDPVPPPLPLPVKLEFDFEIGRALDNGGYKMFPTKPITIKKGTQFRAKEI